MPHVSAMSIAETAADIREDFSWLEDWEARYAHIIDLGKANPPLEPHERTEETRVRGCASQVWLVTGWEDGKLVLRAESDAMIVSGLIALLVQLYTGATREEILSFDAKGLPGRDRRQRRPDGPALQRPRLHAGAHSGRRESPARLLIRSPAGHWSRALCVCQRGARAVVQHQYLEHAGRLWPQNIFDSQQVCPCRPSKWVIETWRRDTPAPQLKSLACCSALLPLLARAHTQSPGGYLPRFQIRHETARRRLQCQTLEKKMPDGNFFYA
jgi:cysteine desulfuration protein SufE